MVSVTAPTSIGMSRRVLEPVKTLTGSCRNVLNPVSVASTR